MRKPKLFFCEAIDDESCYSLDYFKQKMEDEFIKQLDLTEAVPHYGDGAFYCSVFNVAGSVSDSDCGKSCKEYKPRNGKNGRCRFSKNCYEEGSRKFKLTKNGLEELK